MNNNLGASVRKVRIGTRGSLLAMAQTDIVSARLRTMYPELEIEVQQIKTTGDTLYKANLALIGGKGLFLKEIEEALIADQVDIAVHSMKDVPVAIHPELAFSCVLEREDPRDVFISASHAKLMDMPQGSVIGTCSTRRTQQLLRLRPDFQIIPLRGNVNTRLAKLAAGEMDGVVLAAAGLRRLDVDMTHMEIMSAEKMTPAVTQGIITIEHRAADDAIAAMLLPLNHEPTMRRAVAERAYMEMVQGNCTTPAAGYTELDEASGHMRFYAMYAGPRTSGEFKYMVLEGDGGTPEAARKLGKQAGERIVA